jgi:peptidoglycan/xylan/chitin deacetylase (PgdA/CDA1 family)
MSRAVSLTDAGSLPRSRIVLMYHRVAMLSVDPFGLCVSPENFQAQMEVLARRACPVELAVIAERDGVSPGPADGLPEVAVTFDDGYADNFLCAYPVLRQFGIPATIFVVASEDDREFWWDELERALLHSRSLPLQLSLAVNGRQHEWQVDSDRETELADAYQRFRTWQPDPKGRCRLYTDLWAILYGMHSEDRRQVLARILRWAGDDGITRETHRRATIDEIRRVANEGLVDIGGHTCTHPSLAQLPPADQRREIVGCKQWLENALGNEVGSFCYPFGHEVDVDAETTQLVRDAGFRRACVNHPATVTFTTDPFRLPRHYVPDLNGPEFAAWLNDTVDQHSVATRRELAARDERIEQLQRGCEWQEQQAANWERTARERVQLLKEQRAWIDELEAGKQWLEEQWRAWKTLAERKDVNSQ